MSQVSLDEKAGWSSYCRRGETQVCAAVKANCENPAHRRRRQPKPPLALVQPEKPAEAQQEAAGHDGCGQCGSARTEREVAADALAAVLRSGLTDDAHELARVAKLPMEDLRAALRRWDAGAWKPPSVRQANRRRPERSPSSREAWNRRPEGETRECPKCGVDQSINNFRVRTDSGTRRTWCDDCVSRYQRERYLSIDKQKAAGNILRVVLRLGDGCLGDPCPDCKRPLEADQEAMVVDAVFRHADCRDSFD